MTLETFFEKFNQFADAPNAVAMMRELILELAVRGKLSEALGEDDTDPEWVELTRELDSEAPVFGFEPPFEIPARWRWTTPARVGDTKPRNDAPDAASSSFVPMTLIPAEFGQTARHGVRPWSEIKKGYTHFRDGDVVLAKITPCFENGKSSVMKGLTGGFGAGTTELHVFRGTSKCVLPEYVVIFLKTRGFITRGIPRMTGSAGQKRVPSDYFANSPFPLPPPAEQGRIVQKVEELMALCDQLEEQQQKRDERHAVLTRAALARFADAPTAANLQLLFHPSYAISPADLRKTVLTLAVQGKLVPQDPDDEPVKDLLARNDSRRREKARSDHRADEDSQTVLSVADRWDIPDTWSWRGLADLVLFVDYRGKTPAKLSSGIRLLTAKNVRKGRVNLSPDEFLSESEYHSWMTRGFPKAGDVLFTTEAPMGNAAVVELTERFALAQRVICFQSYAALDPFFLVVQILSEPFQGILEKHGTGVTATGIKASKLKQLPIAVAPLAEQKRIVAKVDELMALVDQLEGQLVASRLAAAKLLEAAVFELTTAQ